MAKKEKGKTGFRNGDLFCFNCGRSYTMPLPQPVSMASAMMLQFAKDHEKCLPTWTEPVNEAGAKSETENANWWALHGEHGISSETMFNKLSAGLQVRAMKVIRQSHPHDPDDFSRCYKLLQAVPQWKDKLQNLKSLSPQWEKLVDNWDKLTEMFEQNERENWKNYKKIGMYELMESCTRPVITPQPQA